MNSSPPGYAWLLFALTFMQGRTTHTYAARFVHIHTLFLCLRFGSNSLFAGFSCSYTHVYVLVFASWVQFPFRSLLRVCIPTYTSVGLFLGLTPFLQVFCICTPTCAFLYLFFGSNSLLAGVLCLYTHVYIPLFAFWV